MHFRPLDPKRVIEESLACWRNFNVLFGRENMGQNIVRSGIHDIALTGNIVTEDIY